MLVPLPLDKHLSLPVTSAHYNITLPCGGVLGAFCTHSFHLELQKLDSQSSVTVLPGINPHHKKKPPSPAHSRCSSHHCHLLSHWTWGMSELIPAKTQWLSSFPFRDFLKPALLKEKVYVQLSGFFFFFSKQKVQTSVSRSCNLIL